MLPTDFEIFCSSRSHQPWAHTVVGNGSYTPESAAAAIRAGRFDLVAIGRPFIANPDLVDRIRQGRDVAPYDAAMLATLD